jgi:hypothetical protein
MRIHGTQRHHLALGYFQMMADFIRDGRIGGHYGNAQITQPDREPRGRGR